MKGDHNDLICLYYCSLLGAFFVYTMVGTTMSNQFAGKYKGVVDLIDRGDKGPWALLDAERFDDETDTPLVQVGLTEEQFAALAEDDDVEFELGNNGVNEAYLIYSDETEQPDDLFIVDIKKI